MSEWSPPLDAVLASEDNTSTWSPPSDAILANELESEVAQDTEPISIDTRLNLKPDEEGLYNIRINDKVERFATPFMAGEPSIVRTQVQEVGGKANKDQVESMVNVMDSLQKDVYSNLSKYGIVKEGTLGAKTYNLTVEDNRKIKDTIYEDFKSKTGLDVDRGSFDYIYNALAETNKNKVEQEYKLSRIRPETTTLNKDFENEFAVQADKGKSETQLKVESLKEKQSDITFEITSIDKKINQVKNNQEITSDQKEAQLDDLEDNKKRLLQESKDLDSEINVLATTTERGPGRFGEDFGVSYQKTNKELTADFFNEQGRSEETVKRLSKLAEDTDNTAGIRAQNILNTNPGISQREAVKKLYEDELLYLQQFEADGRNKFVNLKFSQAQLTGGNPIGSGVLKKLRDNNIFIDENGNAEVSLNQLRNLGIDSRDFEGFFDSLPNMVNDKDLKAIKSYNEEIDEVSTIAKSYRNLWRNNVDVGAIEKPSSAGFFFQSAGKEIAKYAGLNEKEADDFISGGKGTARTRINNLDTAIKVANQTEEVRKSMGGKIDLTDKQKENIDVSLSEEVATGIGSFVPDLMILGATGGVMNGLGYAKLISKMSPMAKFVTGALVEEAKMQLILDMKPGGGATFYTLGQATAGLTLFKKKFSWLDPIFQKVIKAGPIGAISAEGAQVSELAYESLIGDKNFNTEFEELYSDFDKVFRRTIVNSMVFGATGFTHVKRGDLMTTRRKYEVVADLQARVNELMGLPKETATSIESSGGVTIPDALKPKKNFEDLTPKEQKKFMEYSKRIQTLNQMIQVETMYHKLDPNSKNFEKDFDQMVTQPMNKGIKAVIPKFEGVKVKFGRGKEFRKQNFETNDKGQDLGNTAEYNPKTKEMFFDLDYYTAGKPVHEFTHAAVNAYFDANPNAKRNFTKRMSSIFSDFDFGQYTGTELETKIKNAYGLDLRKVQDRNLTAEEYLAFMGEFLADPKLYYTDTNLASNLMNEFRLEIKDILIESGIEKFAPTPKTAKDMVQLMALLGKSTRMGSKLDVKIGTLAKLDEIDILGTRLIEGNKEAVTERQRASINLEGIVVKKSTPEILKENVKLREEIRQNKDNLPTIEQRDRIVENNMGLVINSINKYESSTGFKLSDDIKAEAILQMRLKLFEYANKYDASKNDIGAYLNLGYVKQVPNVLRSIGAFEQKVDVENFEQFFDKNLDFSEKAPETIRTDTQGKQLQKVLVEPISIIKDKTKQESTEKSISNRLVDVPESYKNTPDLSNISSEFGVRDNRINNEDGTIRVGSFKFKDSEFKSAQDKFSEPGFLEQWYNIAIPEGQAGPGAREGIRGTDTGLQQSLKNIVYEKTGAREKTGPGKETQVKKPFNEVEADLQKLLGIEPGKDRIQNSKVNTALKNSIHQLGKAITNRAIRKNIDLTANQIENIQSGKSPIMASKILGKPGILEKQSQILEEAGQKMLDARTFEGRVKAVKYIMEKYGPEFIEIFGEVSGDFFRPSIMAPSGNEGYSYFADGKIKGGAIKRAQLFINDFARTIKSRVETGEALKSGELGQLSDLVKMFKNTEVKSLPAEIVNNIKTALKGQKTPDLNRNLNTLSQHRKGSEQILYLFRDLYNKDNANLPGIAYMLYNQNANSSFYRNLAQLTGIEKGIKGKTREEHVLQAGNWANLTLEAIANKNPKIFDGWNKWQAENYYQITLSKTSEGLVDGTYSINRFNENKLQEWKAKSQLHPELRESLLEAFKTGDFSKVLDPAIRMYNEYFTLNPNNITREGITDAKRYNVEIPKKYENNPDVVSKQGELIYQQIKGEIKPEVAKQIIEAEVKLADGKQAAKLKDIAGLKETGVIYASKDLTLNEVLGKAKTIDESLRLARNLNKKKKKIRVFDFDDTLAKTKSLVFAEKDGKIVELTAEEFAEKGKSMVDDGWVMDFSDFNKIRDGKKGPLFDVAKKIAEARGTEDVFVLTARAPESRDAIYEFLKSQGLELPLENITGLGNSTGEAKANWIVEKAAEGYNDFYFADDAYQNVNAVRNALDIIDVKSRVQQVLASKDLNTDFNKLLEKSTGVDYFKEYSAAKAKTVGASKGKFKFFIPYSAEDFTGLIYPTLSKGKVGDAQMAWYKENLFNPYSRAMDNLSRDRVQLMADFKELKKQLDVPKDLRKKNESGFTNEQAVRVYLFEKTGSDMTKSGLSKTDRAELLDIVNNDGKLKAFADQILTVTKGDGYAKPGDSWLAGTITTDLIDLLNTTKRGKYLEEWKQNVDQIYSKENLNKLEAIYGTKYREALENSLARMKSGKNRLLGGNRLSNQMLDYINGSNAAIMFFNMRSAVLQTISSINYVNWSFNNPLRAGKALANQPQFWKDVKTLLNSNYLMDRRNGLRLNINESEIADAASTSKNKFKAGIQYILQKGYLPTQFADSFAIASGGATFYRNRINDLTKKGVELKEAEAQALLEWRQISEESQQSANPSKISQQQASDAGRLILMFANTPMQYARIMKRAGQDLINRRGDAKTNISKIAYYGFVQNLLFNGLQNALFKMGFDDTDEVDEKGIYRTANGMLDGILKGTGIGGAAVSVGKNFLMDVYERSNRDRPEYVDAAWKLTQFSPPLGSKISKIKQAAYAFDNKKMREEIYSKGFSLDNPAMMSGAKTISATTNVPLDRLLQKYNNIDAALAEDTELWERIAMLGGWPEWQIKQETQKEVLSNKDIKYKEPVKFKKGKFKKAVKFKKK